MTNQQQVRSVTSVVGHMTQITNVQQKGSLAPSPERQIILLVSSVANQ